MHSSFLVTLMFVSHINGCLDFFILSDEELLTICTLDVACIGLLRILDVDGWLLLTNLDVDGRIINAF